MQMEKMTFLTLHSFSTHSMVESIVWHLDPMAMLKSQAALCAQCQARCKNLSVATNLTPKFAVCEASAAAGGLMSAASAGELPRGRQQVADMRRRSEFIRDISISRKKDPLFSIMLMCKEGEGSKQSDPFVRAVNGAPEPMAVMSFEWTLNDLERFCTGSPFSILSFDPTFSLGDFDVTVTTYRHLMLVNSVGKHPVMIGPLFIHQRKKFESYYYFASSLVGLRPALRNLLAFGTDGEKALWNALHTVFDKALHLRCFLHFKGNLEAKLHDLNIPKRERVMFLQDVFGN